MRDYLKKLKLRIRDSNDEKDGICKCDNISYDTCNIFYLRNKFQNTVQKKVIK